MIPLISPPNQRIIAIYPHLNRFLNLHKENHNKIKDYYQYSYQRVSMRNIVLQLVNHTPPFDHDLIRLYHRIETLALTTANAFKMTHSAHFSNSFLPGHFLGNQCEEIIIANFEPFSIQEAFQNWRTLEPVIFHYHELLDYNLTFPNGGFRTQRKHHAVISINIALLMVQYLAWKQHQLEVNEYVEEDRTFVANYPLANSLKSMIEVAHFNIFLRLLQNELLPIVDNHQHPIYLNTYYNETISTIKNVIQNLQRFTQSFDIILYSLNGIFSPLGSSIQWVDMAPTRQSLWSELIVKLPYYKALLYWDDHYLNRSSRLIKNEIYKEIRVLENDRLINNQVSPDLLSIIRSDINYIKNLTT